MLTEVNTVRLLGLLQDVRVVTADGVRGLAAVLVTDNGAYGRHSITIPADAQFDEQTRRRLERAAACGTEQWAVVEGCLRSARPRGAAPAPATVLVRRLRVMDAARGDDNERGWQAAYRAVHDFPEAA